MATQFYSHMATDQYGNTYHDLGRHPRKALMEKLGSRHADRMYQDSKDGGAVVVGWIIGGHWLSVYKVVPMRVKA